MHWMFYFYGDCHSPSYQYICIPVRYSCRITISYGVWGAISAQIMGKHHSLLCRSTLYLYLLCIILPLVNMREQDVSTVHYFVSSKNNDRYYFQHLRSVRMLPMLAPIFLTIIWQLQTSNHLIYNLKLEKIDARFDLVCMLRLSLNSYLDDTAHKKKSWSKLKISVLKPF